MNNESGNRSKENIALSSKYNKPLFINSKIHYANPCFESLELLNRYHEDLFMCNSSKQENLVVKPSNSSYQNLSLYSRRLNTGITDNINKNKNFSNIKLTYQESDTIQREKITPNVDINVEHYHKNPDGQMATDKATYCRPVRNFYNQQFLFKTIEKNARLQILVKELIKVRQREKERENWNKFINDLRWKHGKASNMGRAISLQYPPDEYLSLESNDDCYNTEFKYSQSNLCHCSLKDFSDSKSNTTLGNLNGRNTNMWHQKPQHRYSPFEANLICYPTSSQGRLILLERERQKLLKNREHKQSYVAVKEENMVNKKNISTTQNNIHSASGNCVNSSKIGFLLNNRGTNTATKTSDTQTEHHMFPLISKVACKNTCTDVPHDTQLVQDSLRNSENTLKQISLYKIEEKLDGLIQSINNFILEIKTKKFIRPDKDGGRPSELDKENINLTKSDSCGIANKEKNICGLFGDASKSSMNSSGINIDKIHHIGDNLKDINDIILNTIHKDKFITLKDSAVGDTFQPCSVQISVTIPTKDISTEVTKSLSKAAYRLEDEIYVIEDERNDRRIAIAVNTEPVSLLALLRVSTEETLRKLLAFVPSIDYYYYLSRLNVPLPRENESHFVCNICGAEFGKSSLLTEHIRSHELRRDCCVCRHILDMSRRPPGVFKCQYCGKRFTRAYCCELHQQSCARRLGVPHDVSSNLLLLR